MLASDEGFRNQFDRDHPDFHGDVARAESYGVAYHRKEGGEPRQNLSTGFRFVDRFERRDGDWRIARRVATTEWCARSGRRNTGPFPTTCAPAAATAAIPSTRPWTEQTPPRRRREGRR